MNFFNKTTLDLSSKEAHQLPPELLIEVEDVFSNSNLVDKNKNVFAFLMPTFRSGTEMIPIHQCSSSQLEQLKKSYHKTYKISYSEDIDTDAITDKVNFNIKHCRDKTILVEKIKSFINDFAPEFKQKFQFLWVKMDMNFWVHPSNGADLLKILSSHYGLRPGNFDRKFTYWSSDTFYFPRNGGYCPMEIGEIEPFLEPFFWNL